MKKIKSNRDLLKDIDKLALIRTVGVIIQVCLMFIMLIHVMSTNI